MVTSRDVMTMSGIFAHRFVLSRIGKDLAEALHMCTCMACSDQEADSRLCMREPYPVSKCSSDGILVQPLVLVELL